MTDETTEDHFITRPEVLEARRKTADLVQQATVAANDLHHVTNDLNRMIEEFRRDRPAV